ncbi:sensor histidine kinase [Chromobacterium rhizoryzae]|uniref:histidine kinase n=1 Tax=Chromobacterium rhizoryzae TaxID=1778675 RepID=A0AAD0W8S6_9NEIS|nr:PAS domain-containing sensor histidine kinase [Chromobacterium rhizoryzae]AXT46677.1 PAS domain-containing sensor histidine kinase [Chromobacterium rhizoryzae]
MSFKFPEKVPAAGAAGNAGLASVVEAAPVGVLVVAVNGRMLYVNSALENMFGYSKAQLLGQPVEMLLPAEIRERHLDFRQLFFANPTPRTMGSGRELFAQHADGRQFPIEIGLGSMPHDDEVCAVAFVSDITPRRRLEHRFSKVVSSLPIGLLMAGADGRISMTNQALDAMFGYPPGELVGKPVEVLLPQRVRNGHPALRSAFAKAPEVRAMGSGRDLLAQHRDGSEFPVEVGLTPLETEGERQVLAAITDISLRKKFEETLQQANAQLEEFTYVASHDLRSPLRGIADLISWIREDLDPSQLSADIEKNFARAEERIARAERMIEDLLEYARAGRQDERVEEIDPGQLVRETVDLLDISPDFRLEVEINARPFPAARTPLSLAIRNLLSNACKHHGGGKGVIRITVEEEGRFNLFTVEDDGVGVPEGSEERIFKLFHRASSQAAGHGVGLAVTRRMVNSNGGTVILDRNGMLGGACFRIRWPRFPLKEVE